MTPAILLCLVLAVPDGDGLRVQCDGQPAPIAIRVKAADAPELPHRSLRIAEQPYGREAQANLAALCYGKRAEVEPHGISFQRTVAVVRCDGVDVASAQVAAGYAWAWRPSKRSPLRALEAQARAQHVGLWADPQPVAPWAWRRMGLTAASGARP